MKKTVRAPLLPLALLILTIIGIQWINWVNANPYGPPQSTLIAIQADGTVAPADSPLKHVGGNQYVLTENLTGTIVSLFERYYYRINIEKDDIVLDGANHTINGHGRVGIEIAYRNNVTVQNIVLCGYEMGIEVYCSSNINITDSSILSGTRAVFANNSSKLIIAKNIFADNYEQATIQMDDCSMAIVYGNQLSCRRLEGWLINGLRMEYCQNNVVAANTIRGFYCGIGLLNSSNNHFLQNNLVENDIQALDFLRDKTFQRNNQTHHELNQRMLQQNITALLSPVWDYSTNLWQNNYWSNYNGSAGGDVIGTTPFVIDELNVDSQPSMNAVSLEDAISLSSISLDFVSDPTDAEHDASPWLPVAAAVAVIAVVVAVAAVLILKKRKQSNTGVVKNP
jgi:parallel beta-helix repeat protein